MAVETPALPSPNAPGVILFLEDFEDEDALALTFIEEGNWSRVIDEKAGGVFDINNLSGTGYPQMRLGSGSWRDYAIEFRARIVDFASSRSTVFCIFRLQTNWYHLGLEPENAYNQLMLGYIQPSQGSWDFHELGSSPVPVERGVWYPIRIEAQGTRIRVLMDGNPIIEATDSRQSQGDLTIGVGPGTHAQFDDIRVVAMGE
jgi:hypothetical protein